MGAKQSVVKPTVSENDAVQTLNTEIGRLKKNIDHRKLIVEKEQLLAIQCMKATDKVGAMRHLQNKKKENERIESLTKMLFNLETQLSTLETVQTSMNVLRATNMASTVIKNTAITTDKADDIMEEAIEQVENVKQITSILTTPIDNTNVDDEFEQLAHIMEPKILDMPLPPTTVPENTVVETELRKLVEA
jgi:hypothetical protein